MDRQPTERKTFARLPEAVSHALDLHGGQAGKGCETPHVSHLLGVASLVIEHGGDEDQAIAAIFCCGAKDAGTDLDAEIRERYGDRVADMAMGCTPSDTFPKGPWEERKQAYLSHLRHAGADTLLVACAGKVHDARAICTDLREHGIGAFQRLGGGMTGTLWFYRCLSDTFSHRLPGALARELDQAVGLMHTLASRRGAPGAASSPDAGKTSQ